jgi:hypothetical protein
MSETLKAVIFDAATGEVTERPLTADEIAEREVMQAEAEARQAEAEAKVAARESALLLIKRLTPEQLKIVGTHTESGEYSVQKWIDTYTRHPQEHAEQLLAD